MVKLTAFSLQTSIQQCCLQLKSKIAKKIQAREQQERKRNLTRYTLSSNCPGPMTNKLCSQIDFFVPRYIPDATGAIYDVLKEMAHSHATKKKRYEAEDAELLRKVSSRVITKDTLSEKLAQYVEKVRVISCTDICQLLQLSPSSCLNDNRMFL